MFKNVLLKNSVFNLAGYAIPTIVAIPALGILARNLGPELFGVYTLAMAIVGYASIFDFGLTRAIIREVAINKSNPEEKKRVISTATIFLISIGLFVAVAIYLNISEIIHFINLSAVNDLDVINAIKILSISIPFFLLNQLWVSILEGEERFGVLNLQKTIANTFIVGLPALFILYHPSLTYAMWGLVLGRLVSLIISFWVIKYEILTSGLKFHLAVFQRLVLFGGWMTVSNVISPMMVYFDRFIISNILGAKNVGYYTAPAEIISRMSIVPNSIARAVFPRLSNLSDYSNYSKELKFSYRIMLLVCLPLILFLFIFAHEVIYYWLGPEYVSQSTIIFVILLTGFVFNALAQIPFAAIQALGKSKTTALLHCAEIIPYLILLFFATKHYGIVGASIVWSLRVLVDFLALFILSKLLNKKYEKSSNVMELL